MSERSSREASAERRRVRREPDASGNRRRIIVYGATRAECQAAARALLARLQRPARPA